MESKLPPRIDAGHHGSEKHAAEAVHADDKVLNGNEKAFSSLAGGIAPDDTDVDQSPVLTDKERLVLGGDESADCEVMPHGRPRIPNLA
jgi:hypothetical protein